MNFFASSAFYVEKLKQRSCIESQKIVGIPNYCFGCQNDFGQSRWHRYNSELLDEINYPNIG